MNPDIVCPRPQRRQGCEGILLIAVVRVLDPHQGYLRNDRIEIKQLKGWRA